MQASLLSSHSEDSEPESAPSFVEPLLSDSVDSKTENGSQGLDGTSTDIHEASLLCSGEESQKMIVMLSFCFQIHFIASPVA